jgi:signal transduction histidine kinase
LLWIAATMAFALTADILSWMGDYRRSAVFYLAGWIGLFMGVSGRVVMRLDISPFVGILPLSFSFLGFVWMGVLWSLALADGIRVRQAKTDRANRETQTHSRQLDQTLAALPVGILLVGPDRKLNCLNPPALKYTATRVVDNTLEYPLEGLPIEQAFEGKNVWVDDLEADLIGQRITLQAAASPVLDEQGMVEAVAVVLQDITQRKKDEAERQENYRHLEKLLEDRNAQLRVSTTRVRAEIAERQRLEDGFRVRLEWLVATNIANQAVLRTSDLSQVYENLTAIINKLFGGADVFISELDEDFEQIIIRTHAILADTHPDWQGMAVSLPTDIRSQQIITQGDQIIIRKDQFDILGSDLSENLHAAEYQSLLLAPMLSQKKIIGLLGLTYFEAVRLFSANEIMLITSVCADIVQIVESARLFEQTQAIIATEERSRLARDLHDSVTQVLFAANLVAEVLPQIWRRDTVQAMSSLEELRRLIRSALAEMRTLLIDLRPATLIKTPLNDLLAQLAEVAAGRINRQITLLVDPIPLLPEEVHLGFYRIAQESLNNIVKHAFADQVEIRLSATPVDNDTDHPLGFELTLIVRDNGRGFIPEGQAPQRMGHAIMRERAAAINANLTVESERGFGTVVTLIWPGKAKGF